MTLRYVKTTDIKAAVDGSEELVLDQVVADWRKASPHIRCPYPEHGGEDDWRWDKKKKHAICTCTTPHADSIFDVVRKCEGLEFEDAKLRVAEMIGRQDLIKEKLGDGRRYQKTDAASLLNAPADSRDDELPRRYLAYRLGVAPDLVVMPLSRAIGIKELDYFDPPKKRGAKPVVVASPPCAVFATRNADNLTHAHRIYLAPDGQGKAELGVTPSGQTRDAKKSAKILADGDNTAGRSVFWGDPRKAEWIIVTEGIETGAAVAFAFRTEIEAGSLSVAAAIASAGVAAFLPWSATKRITVAADRDEAARPERPNATRGAGNAAARALCLRVYKTIAAFIALPGAAGDDVDWLDIHERSGAEAVHAGILAAASFTPTLDEEGEKQQHDDRAAELAEISSTYPLPELNSLRLIYDHTPSGQVFIHKVVPPTKAGDSPSYVPVSSPFGIVARLRRVDQADAYSLRAVVQDMTGATRTIEFTRADLAKQGGSEVRANLYAAGLRTEGDGDGVVIQCLKAAHPESEVVLLARSSWHEMEAGKPPIFIAPSGEVIGISDGKVYELAGPARMPPDIAVAGTMDGWKAAIKEALDVLGCEHWAFGLMAGFAGPLVSLTGLDTCGINLSGQSSGGKSTAQRLAASAWSTPDIRKPGLCQSARSTDNAIESAAARSDGTILVLDELAHVEGKMVGKIIYMLAGGVGRKRMKADATVRASYTWSTFALLSGECSLEEKVISGGGDWMAGMAVRIPDVDITGINRSVDPVVMRRIEKIDEHYGHAGPAFIRTLTDNDIHRRPVALREAIKAAAAELAGADVDPMVRRAAEPFVIVGLAGGMAQEAGILPAGLNVTHVIGWAWSRFRTSSSNNVVLAPEEQIVLRIRTWIAERWNVTIKGVDAESGNREAVGWYDGDAVYIPKDRLREAAGEAMKEIAIAKILDDLGHIRKRKSANHVTVGFIPKIGNLVAYALDRSAFGRSGSATGFSLYRGGRSGE